jgi:hypothetical protein
MREPRVMTDEAIEALWANRPATLAPTWKRPATLAPTWKRPATLAPTWKRPATLAPTWKPKKRSWAAWVRRLLRAWGLSR